MAKRSPRDRAPGRPGPELNDKDHEFILSNPEANKALAREAIARAIAEDVPMTMVHLLGVSWSQGGSAWARTRVWGPQRLPGGAS